MKSRMEDGSRNALKDLLIVVFGLIDGLGFRRYVSHPCILYSSHLER